MTGRLIASAFVTLLGIVAPVALAQGVAVRTFDLQQKCVTEEAVLDVFLAQPRQPERASLPAATLHFEVSGQAMSPKPALGNRQLQIVNQFFAQEFNYASFDGQGTGLFLLSNLALSSDGANCNPMNAFFANLGPDNVSLVAVLLGHPESPYDLAKDLEVIAHEFGHGVFRTAQGMELSPQERGINEGVSDMLGVTVRAWFESGQRLADARVRADSFLIGKYYGELITRYYDAPEAIHEGYMRNLLNPYPWDTADHVDLLAEARFQGEHAASGIVSLPFALLVKGGRHPRRQDITVTVQGIGFEKAITIIFYVLKQRLPFSTMPEFAAAAIKAAERIYGQDSQPAISTRNAFAVTGLVTPYPAAETAPQEREAVPEPEQQAPETASPAPAEPETPSTTDAPSATEPEAPDQAPPTTATPLPTAQVPGTTETSARGVSGPVFLLGLAVFLVLLMIAGHWLTQRRRRQLLDMPSATAPAPVAGVSSPLPQRPPVHLNIPSSAPLDAATTQPSLPATLRVGAQSAALWLTDRPLTLGRRSAQLPATIVQALQADEWIGREHCQIWYRADTHQVYVQCLSRNGLLVNQQSLQAGEKAKVAAPGDIHLRLGETLLVVSC